MQTILGSGGVIGIELAGYLQKYTDRIRLVSRTPKKVNSGDETFSADLLDRQQVMKAVEGSGIVYLTAGLPYDSKIWAENWPVIMTNVIEACKKYDSKLVFFDNVYMYGKVDGKMTEETPVNPCSRKGEVRAKIAGLLLDEMKIGNIRGLIARSADFYGPGATNTAVHLLICEKFRNGKKSNWPGNDKLAHSFTYTPDAGKATALLGNTEEAYNQVWHLPTSPEKITGEEMINMFAKEFSVPARYSRLRPLMMKMAGMFNKTVKEMLEMMYQMEYDYIFDSSKFNNKFFKPTNYLQGIKDTAKIYK